MRLRRHVPFALACGLALGLASQDARVSGDEGAPGGPPLPAAPADELVPYGETPDFLVPHRNAGEPATRFFRAPPVYRGPWLYDPVPDDFAEVRVGVIAPLSGHDQVVGRRVRNGYVLAFEEVNLEGGYRPGVPFRLLERDEHDTWGAAGNALVELVTRQGCVAVLGAMEDEASHVMTRVLLKLGIPMMNTNGTDPTLTEHMIPWLVRVRPDDRQAAYLLARRIFLADRRERVVYFRANDRYARKGIGELSDAARRLGKPIALEMRYPHVETDLSRQVERLAAAKPDAVVLWGRAAPTGRALAALRAGGVTVPVYGPDRLVDPDFLAAAGPAAEGLVVAVPFDARQDAPAWAAFRERYRARFAAEPDHQAAYAYDGARLLLETIRRVGAHGARVREALFAMPTVAGVGAPIRFDVNHNNVSPMRLARVERGAFVMEPR